MGYIGISEDVVRRSEGFASLSVSKEMGLYFYIRSYIVRGYMKSNKFLGLYENFFLKGLLASRWSQIDMAKHFNVSQQTISRWAKKLEKRGLIKIYKVYSAGKIYNIYVLGTINLDNKKELLFFDEIFAKEIGNKMLDSMRVHSNNEYPDTH